MPTDKTSSVVRSVPGMYHTALIKEELDGYVALEERSKLNSWCREALPKASIFENLADLFRYCGGGGVTSHVLWSLWISSLWPLAGLLLAAIGGTVIYWNFEVLSRLRVGFIWYLVRIIAVAIGVILVFI